MTKMSAASIQVLAPYGNFDKQVIGGVNRVGRGDGTTSVSNPYTGQVLIDIRNANVADVDDAFKAAHAAQRAWASFTPGERARVLGKAVTIMDARKEEIVVWLIRESSSTRIKATLEWQATRDMLIQFSALPYQAKGEILPPDVPEKENSVYRRPLGVTSVISPWNWPLRLTTRSVAPALALGNAVVVKPGGETPITGGLLLARVFEEAGLPPGLLNVVVGQSSEIGDPFVLHPLSPFISFTGSTAVGRRLGSLTMTGTVLKRIALELGGNAPLIVLADADLQQAISAAVVGKFLHQGKICVATNRIIIHAAVYDDFAAGYLTRVKALKIGDPNDSDLLIGPVISIKRMSALRQLIKTGLKSGATLALRGEPSGLVLPPHVFTDIGTNSSLTREEIFGPITPIIRADDDEAALSAANESEFGLSSAIFTCDTEHGVRLVHRLDWHDPYQRHDRQRCAKYSFWRRKEFRSRPIRHPMGNR